MDVGLRCPESIREIESVLPDQCGNKRGECVYGAVHGHGPACGPCRDRALVRTVSSSGLWAGGQIRTPPVLTQRSSATLPSAASPLLPPPPPPPPSSLPAAKNTISVITWHRLARGPRTRCMIKPKTNLSYGSRREMCVQQCRAVVVK